MGEFKIEARSHKLKIFFLFVLIFLTYIPHFNTFPIWDNNEGYYIETPKEMIINHNYIISTFNYTFRMNKPPFSYWFVILFYKIFGISITSERIGILFVFFIILFLVYKFGFFITNDRYLSIFIVAILAFSPRYFLLAHKDIINLLLDFFIISSLYFFYRFYKEGKRLNLTFFYISLSLGFLTKGPVAILIPSLSIFFFLLFIKKLKFLKKLISFEMFLFPILVLPYYYRLYQIDGFYFIKRFFLFENVLRYTEKSFGPHRNFLYYIKVFFIDFFPWSIFFIYSLKFIKRDRSEKNIFLLISFIVPILFFSFSKNKQEYYIISSYPFAAIYMCEFLIGEEVILPGLLKKISLIFLFTFVFVYLTLSYLLVSRDSIYIVIFFIFLFFSYLLYFRKKRFSPVHLLILLIPFYIVFQNFVFVKLAKYRPIPQVAKKILEKKGNFIVFNCGRNFPSLVYYLNRRVEFLDEDEEVFIKNFMNWRKGILLSDEKVYLSLKKMGLKFKLLGKYKFLETKGKIIFKLLKSKKYRYLYLISN